MVLRLDVAFVAASLSRFLTNPGLKHYKAADRTIRYLYYIRFLGIRYSRQDLQAQVLLIVSDVSFANDEIIRKSSYGYIILFIGGPIA